MKTIRSFKTSFALFALTALTVLGLVTSRPALGAASFYSITDLGSGLSAYDINNKGEVVGDYYNGSFSHAYLYSDGQLQDLGTLPNGDTSLAYSLNNQSQVVGRAYAQPNNYDTRAVLWDSNGINDLGSFPDGGFFNGAAFGINESGQVVGQGQHGLGTNPHAFLYSGGPLQDLGTLGGNSSLASSINRKGQVVGLSQTLYGSDFNGFSHAFLYSGGSLQDLGTLGGGTVGVESRASSINNKGQVVGSSTISPHGRTHAFLWDSSNGMQDLGTLASFDASFANDINDKGEVVGDSTLTITKTGGYQMISHAFLYSNGQLQDLNEIPHSSGWDFQQAKAINDRGQIVGAGTINGQPHAFIATPRSLVHDHRDRAATKRHL